MVDAFYLPAGVRATTRAADRARDSVVPGEDIVFKGADKLWQSWQARVVEHQGQWRQRAAAPPVIHHPAWKENRERRDRATLEQIPFRLAHIQRH